MPGAADATGAELFLPGAAVPGAACPHAGCGCSQAKTLATAVISVYNKCNNCISGGASEWRLREGRDEAL